MRMWVGDGPAYARGPLDVPVLRVRPLEGVDERPLARDGRTP